MPACFSASSMTGKRRCKCARAATSGTTPPKRACRAVCEATTLARIRGSSVKTAAAVSSQEVSIARKYISDGHRPCSRWIARIRQRARKSKGVRVSLTRVKRLGYNSAACLGHVGNVPHTQSARRPGFMLDDVDLLVCGAGPAGCVVAERAASVLGWRVLVIDRRQHIAGNCYDRRHSSGVRIHQYGPHYFRTNDAAVVRYLSRFTDWIPANYLVKSCVGG